LEVKVLVVDDDPDTRELVAVCLRSLGATIELVESAESALDVAKEIDPDLVIVDLRLPGISGLELIRELTSDAVTARARVLVLTGDGDRTSPVECLAAGADDYVPKPFGAGELSLRVEGLLRARRARPTA
jgi:DNA-binding response OmpR family regulator